MIKLAGLLHIPLTFSKLHATLKIKKQMGENNNKILLEIKMVDDHTVCKSDIDGEEEARIFIGAIVTIAMRDAGFRSMLAHAMALLLNMAEYEPDMSGNDIDTSKIINDLEQDINNERPSRA